MSVSDLVRNAYFIARSALLFLLLFLRFLWNMYNLTLIHEKSLVSLMTYFQKVLYKILIRDSHLEFFNPSTSLIDLEKG